jgi:biopolymer transport protein ExbD
MLPTLFMIAVVLVSCSKSDQQMQSDSASAPVVKVRLYRDGRLTLGDNPVTISELHGALSRLRSERGSVLYYREAGQEEPLPVAREVMQAIVEARLPVRLSTRPDFSDAVGADGVPRSR